jgi:hypothetical protein
LVAGADARSQKILDYPHYRLDDDGGDRRGLRAGNVRAATPGAGGLAITPELFRAALKRLGLTIEAFAHDNDVDPVTVAGWGKERPGRGLQRFPRWVAPKLEAMEIKR